MTRAAFGIAVVLYVVAKLAELNDHELYGWLGAMSGHTLKHLLATMSSAVLAGQLAWRAPGRVAQHGMTPAPIHS
jgi:hypothetical protein